MFDAFCRLPLGLAFDVGHQQQQLHLAVIPTVIGYGPLAVLAMLFPAVFGNVAIVARRWRILCAVLSLNGMLYWAHSILCDSLQPEWWETRGALWSAQCINVAVGALWSFRRTHASDGRMRASG